MKDLMKYGKAKPWEIFRTERILTKGIEEER